MAWGDPQDYWWLRRSGEQPNRLQAWAQLAQQQRQQQMANEIRQKEMGLQAQRTGLELVEYFSKKELQNKVLAGNAALAKSLQGVTDWTSPDVPRTIMGIGVQHPELIGTEQYKGALQMYENAVKQKNDLQKFNEGWASRERIAAETIAGRENVAGIQAEARKKQWEKQAELTERRLGAMEQNYLARQEIEMLKLEMKKAESDDNYYYRMERLRQIDDAAERLDARLRFDKEKLELKKKEMKPETRLRYEAAIKAVEAKYKAGAFKTKETGLLPTPEQKAQEAANYDRARKAIDDQFFGDQSAGTGAAAPASAGPKVGDVVDGYRFKGGNPADQGSWEKVQ